MSIRLGLSAWVHKALTKIIKAFLCSGSDVVQAGKCLVAWDRVQCPIHLGGLGVLDMKRMGMALRLRWLWFQCTDASRPWAGLPIRDYRLTTAFFKASIRCQVGDGRSTMFWTEPKLHGRTVESLALDLFTVLSGRQWRRRTVDEAITDNSWLMDIQGPLTVPVLIQYIQLREMVEETVLNPEVQDSTLWRWSSSGAYVAHSAYEALFLGQSTTWGGEGALEGPRP
jgi:hypothetical protein